MLSLDDDVHDDLEVFVVQRGELLAGSGKFAGCQVNSPLRVFQPDGANSVPR